MINDKQELKQQSEFFENVASIIEEARSFAGRTVDLTMELTYFEIGRMIVEEEQGGKAKAEYGRKLISELSDYLKPKFGKGFSGANLKNFRKFYQTYEPLIRQKSSAELNPFKLGWSHYQILMRIKDENACKFYEIESIEQHLNCHNRKSSINILSILYFINNSNRTICITNLTFAFATKCKPFSS